MAFCLECVFGQHPAAELIFLFLNRDLDQCSAPGCWPSSETTRDRYLDAKARKNYAGTSPITKASGKSRVVLARYKT